jgi:hypothetical protein
MTNAPEPLARGAVDAYVCLENIAFGAHPLAVELNEADIRGCKNAIVIGKRISWPGLG